MENEKKEPAFTSLRVLSIALLVIGYLAVLKAFDVIRASIEASVATEQVKDSIVTYSLSQEFITSNVATVALTILFAAFLFLALRGPIVKLLKRNSR